MVSNKWLEAVGKIMRVPVDVIFVTTGIFTFRFQSTTLGQTKLLLPKASKFKVQRIHNDALGKVHLHRQDEGEVHRSSYIVYRIINVPWTVSLLHCCTSGTMIQNGLSILMIVTKMAHQLNVRDCPLLHSMCLPQKLQANILTHWKHVKTITVPYRYLYK